MTKTEELLQSCIYKIVRDNAFIGGLLQELTFKFSNEVPTAAIGFDKKTQKYELYFNLDFFQKMEKEQRIAVLMHEILHFLHKHLFRWMQMKVDEKDRFLWNIAADMAINQYIENLPKGSISIDNYKDAKGQPFPKFQPMEAYYDLIQQNREGDKTKGQDLKDPNGEPSKDKNGNSIVDPNGKPYDSKGTGNEGSNKEELDKYTAMDEHKWEDLSDEEKERMAREAEKLIKRTIEKTAYSHSNIPGYVEDFLKDLSAYLRKLNYKAILRNAIKKTVMSQDRENSWKKPNKRFGEVAPGTSLSRTPRINMYVDTSGSISYQELTEFLSIIDGFLKAGNKDCRLVLWHTNPYYNKKYKLNSKLDSKVVQAGGTDPQPTLELIQKTSPDLSIILTDGFYDKSNIKLHSDVIWIISKTGNKDHPNSHIGKTILLEGIK